MALPDVFHGVFVVGEAESRCELMGEGIGDGALGRVDEGPVVGGPEYG